MGKLLDSRKNAVKNPVQPQSVKQSDPIFIKLEKQDALEALVLEKFPEAIDMKDSGIGVVMAAKVGKGSHVKAWESESKYPGLLNIRLTGELAMSLEEAIKAL